VTRSLADSLAWVDQGTALVTASVADLDDVAWSAPSALPGWTRRHLVAHLAANAEAVGRLVHWAATGERTPMYGSPEQRADDIEKGSARSGAELRVWHEEAAATLAAAMDALSADQWEREVVTAQGRTVPASETPWMRAREVMVHAVDLDLGVTFADLPDDFLAALAADVVTKRGDVPEVEGPLDQRVAWLTGRRHGLDAAPELGPWL
jgi:maleylpyruvate isomerase